MYARVSIYGSSFSPGLLLLVLLQGKEHLATVRETDRSSAWNHIFKFQRRGPPVRRTWKVLSLWHAHGSAPRSSYLPCQNLARWKHSELLQSIKQNIPRKKVLPLRIVIRNTDYERTVADVDPVVLLSGCLCFVSSAIQVVTGWSIWVPLCLAHVPRLVCLRKSLETFKSTENGGATTFHEEQWGDFNHDYGDIYEPSPEFRPCVRVGDRVRVVVSCRL